MLNDWLNDLTDFPSSKQTQLSNCFYWGYCLSQVPASQLAIRFGAKTMLFTAALASGCLTIMMPTIDTIGPNCLPVASRMLLGVMQGCTYPCTNMILSKWVHSSERAFLASAAYSGGKIGTAWMMVLSDVIESFLGRFGRFACAGTLFLLWAIAFFVYGASSPENCPGISMQERTFIESMPGGSSGKPPVPWRRILISPAVLSLCIAHTADVWGFMVIMNGIPEYIRHVFKFDIRAVRIEGSRSDNLRLAWDHL